MKEEWKIWLFVIVLVGGLLSRVLFRDTPPKKRAVKRLPDGADESPWRQEALKPPPLPRRKLPPVVRQRPAERGQPVTLARVLEELPVALPVVAMPVSQETRAHLPSSTQLAAMLKNRKMLQSAVALHEVLGPPLCRRRR